MASKAQSGSGVVIAVNTGTVSTPTWTVIGEVTGLTQSGYENETDDVTNLQSTAREFIPTITNPGMWDSEINRYSSDAGQVALVASFVAIPPTSLQYKITYPLNAIQTTTGDTEVFTGIVQKYSKTIKRDKKISIAASWKVSNAPVFTEGS